jgi:hypothetical protein
MYYADGKGEMTGSARPAVVVHLVNITASTGRGHRGREPHLLQRPGIAQGHHRAFINNLTGPAQGGSTIAAVREAGVHQPERTLGRVKGSSTRSSSTRSHQGQIPDYLHQTCFGRGA